MLHPNLLPRRSAASRPVHLVAAADWPALSTGFSPAARAYAEASGFTGKPGRLIVLPGPDGAIERAVLGIEPMDKGGDPFQTGLLAGLPEGSYHLDPVPADAMLALLGFLLATYRFDRYRKAEPCKVRLAVPKGVSGAGLSEMAAAVAYGRDLINTPTADLGPDALAKAALDLAEAHGAKAREIVGKKLLKKNFPMIHAVGRASAEEPRLIDIRWGNPDHPKVTLVGKGVCFDTGGLDIKPDAAMLLMKKDMGGAATALTAARMIMSAGLKVSLRVLLPIVENAISANAFRPGDVLVSRKGLTVEIGNTDAEGRLILADALALADEEAPDLLLDFATLTGAARVALGPDLPPFYTRDEALAGEIAAAGTAVNDPVWRLPLWAPYHAIFDSKIADLNNAGTGGMAGSITAALFLSRFVEKARSYAHFDIYAWVPAGRHGQPQGGLPQVARLVLALLEKRYATPSEGR